MFQERAEVNIENVELVMNTQSNADQPNADELSYVETLKGLKRKIQQTYDQMARDIDDLLATTFGTTGRCMLPLDDIKKLQKYNYREFKGHSTALDEKVYRLSQQKHRQSKYLSIKIAGASTYINQEQT